MALSFIVWNLVRKLFNLILMEPGYMFDGLSSTCRPSSIYTKVTSWDFDWMCSTARYRWMMVGTFWSNRTLCRHTSNWLSCRCTAAIPEYVTIGVWKGIAHQRLKLEMLTFRITSTKSRQLSIRLVLEPLMRFLQISSTIDRSMLPIGYSWTTLFMAKFILQMVTPAHISSHVSVN